MGTIFNDDDEQLRLYLLGALPPTEQQQVETRLLATPAGLEQLLLVEEELIDSYACGELPPHERAQFENYFLSTPEQRQKLNLATAMRRYALATAAVPAPQPQPNARPAPTPESPWWRRGFVPAWGLAAAGLAIIFGSGIWFSFFKQSEVNQGLVALNRAYRTERPLEARIYNFDYAHWSDPRGAGNPVASEKVDQVALDRAAKLLLGAVDERPDPTARAAAGRYYLAGKEFDKAIKQFEAALQTTPDDAALHSDLGAALLEQGKVEKLEVASGKSLELFGRSLEHLNRALELDAAALQALYNRALLYQYLNLPAQAKADWRQYLEKDPHSPWAAEAQEKLRLLEEGRARGSPVEEMLQSLLDAYQTNADGAAWQVLSRSRERTGNVICQKLIDDYLDAAVQGHTAVAAERLRLLVYAGKVESQYTSDRFTSDLAHCYQSAVTGKLPLLAQARAAFKAGHAYFDRSEFELALTTYAQAQRQFALLGATCEAALAELWHGFCFVRMPTKDHLAQGRVRLERLSQLAGNAGYLWLRAQTLNAIADSYTSDNEFAQAIQYANQSREVAGQIKDDALILRNLMTLVSTHTKLNQHREALRTSQQAFSLVGDEITKPRQSWPLYYETALNYHQLGLRGAALGFAQEALRLAKEADWPLIKSRSYARLGLIYEALHRNDEAVHSGLRAIEEARGVTSEKTRTNMIANAYLSLSHVYRRMRELDKAVASYDEAIRLYRVLDFPAYLYEAHKGRLLTHVARHDQRAAQEEIETTLAIFEEYRVKIEDETVKHGFFDVEQSIYDLAMEFAHTQRKDARQAFAYSELCRARALLDLQNAGAPTAALARGSRPVVPPVAHPLPLEEIQRQLPRQAQVVQYSALAERLLVWYITADRFEPAEFSITAEQLSAKVRDFLRALSAGAGEAAIIAQARDLHHILISPVIPWLDHQKELFIVPDHTLSPLPFAALISTDDKYLLETYRLITAPSSTVLINCTNRARDKEHVTAERLLSVGNPRFDRRQFPTLSDLSAARGEAQTIAPFYKPAVVLTDDEARESSIREEVGRADVIHIASHAVVDEDAPARSRLALAHEPEPQPGLADGALHAFEIPALPLARTRLVILSACQTGVGRSYGGEGTVSLARSFLSAGVPLVVASLWPVDSQATAQLMASFHRHRKQENLSTPEALRRAQLEMLRQPGQRQPSRWAPFIAIGGHTTF